MAACENCGSVYAALEHSDGTIRPIGSRDGCTACGETAFTPLPDFEDDSKAAGAGDE
ncbi:hypothetical protein [Halopiger goleimassiliensis]|uniref:hypothetical protein n=1 Tax=Halopiger goleimassiliensis TaxID=1293048 RepID=UPI000A7EA356|nr:hypothetical protein [Halopiger goleimassiliensis]